MRDQSKVRGPFVGHFVALRSGRIGQVSDGDRMQDLHQAIATTLLTRLDHTAAQSRERSVGWFCYTAMRYQRLDA